MEKIVTADRVKVAICDIDGVLRGKSMHRDKFESAKKDGFGFCNVVFGWDCADVCYDNASYTGWHTGYPDGQAVIDLATERTVPWEDNVPFYLGYFEDPVCPRRLLMGIRDKARALGYEAMGALEFEWFNFKETPDTLKNKGWKDLDPLTPGMFGYSMLRSSMNHGFLATLQDELAAFGVPIEGLHTETGPGVMEAAIVYDHALEAADRATLFKTAVKQIGYGFEIMPTFMARINKDLPGCSGHLHLSLWEGERNVFWDENGLSDTFRWFIGGLQAGVPDLLPLFAPTINSYKRLVEGYWAPTRVNWGFENRTVAFRVIRSSEKSARVEVRVPGADCNPYLAMAATIACGLYGIQHKIEPATEPIEGNGYADTKAERLPHTLREATERLATSDIAREMLGAPFVEHYVQTREWEVRQAEQAVTSWELERYFEII